MIQVQSACVFVALLLAKGTGVFSTTEDDILYVISQTDPARRPVRNSSQSVQVSLFLYIIHLVELNEKKQALTLDVWPETMWVNEFVQWEAKDGPSTIVVPDSRLWIPDTYVQNSFSETSDQLEVFLPQGGLLTVSPDGTTEYISSLHLEVSCPVDTTYFPFDTQQCLIHAGSWASTENLVNISLADPAVILGSHTPGSKLSNSQWELTSVQATKESVEYGTTHRSFSEVKFLLTLQRRPFYHVIHLLVPILLLHMLSLATFLVPPEGGERMSVGITTFLSFSVFSLVLMDHLPESSASLPVLSFYVTFALVKNLFSILWSVYVVRTWSRPPIDCFQRAVVPLPARLIRIVSVFTRRRPGQRMCSCTIPNRGDVIRRGHGVDNHAFEDREVESVKSDFEAETEDGTGTQDSQGGQVTEETTCLWHSSLDITDRLFFLILSLLVILSVIVLIIVMPYSQGYY